MQAAERTRDRGAWSTFLRHLFDPRIDVRYCAFLIEQGFEDFMRIPPYSMRHRIAEALVQRFHAKKSTFHLSCGEYIALPIDWTAILGLRFGGYLVLTTFVDFEVACELLGIPYPLTRSMR